MTTQNTPRIAIIGGGPGGLTLARILQTHNIATTVFERESSPDERQQGGSLDLHAESGQLALHLAGLDEQFQAIARYEDQEGRLLDKNGRVLLENGHGEEIGDRPEVDRTELRKLLLNSLELGVVRWGYKLGSICQTDDNTYDLRFENGATETFDLVVGADGAWSRVRPLLSSATPMYTGVTFIELNLDDVDESHPALARLVGHGLMFSLDNNKGLLAQRNGHAHIRVYAAMRIPEGWETANGFDAGNPQAARAWLLNQFADWDQSLLALIQECNDSFAVRPLYMLPVGHRWDFHPGVTLLGDAAHLMSPFSGEGVNLAMLDAADLASAISTCDTLEQAVRTYETTMFPRAESIAREADEGITQAIAPDAPAHVFAFFSQPEANPSFPSTTRKESFANGLTIRLEERGWGRPVLILHGAAGPQSVAGLAEALAQQAHVIVPTHPGFANEPRPEWCKSAEDLAFTYLDLLERLDLRDVTVIGLSFGGWISSELAASNSTRLSGLILIDAIGIQVAEHPINVPRPLLSDQPVPSDGRPAGPQALRAYIGPNGLSDPKLRRRLEHVNIPALCVWGENDAIVAPDYGRAYAQAFPNARFELIPEAGHLPQIEQPEHLFSVVKTFLNNLAASSDTQPHTER